jgi:hypothetical protein
MLLRGVLAEGCRLGPRADATTERNPTMNLEPQPTTATSATPATNGTTRAAEREARRMKQEAAALKRARKDIGKAQKSILDPNTGRVIPTWAFLAPAHLGQEGEGQPVLAAVLRTGPIRGQEFRAAVPVYHGHAGPAFRDAAEILRAKLARHFAATNVAAVDANPSAANLVDVEVVAPEPTP